jgi:hypothetical protein
MYQNFITAKTENKHEHEHEHDPGYHRKTSLLKNQSMKTWETGGWEIRMLVTSRRRAFQNNP